VPDSLRSWWARTDPANLDKESSRSGRCDVLRRVAKLLLPDDRVLDLGCGPGLLAREAGRRDISGVEMSPGMVVAARDWMDEVVPDNLLEHYPLEPPDVVVLCNVLEPYPADIRRMVCSHCCSFVRPGGRVIVVLALGKGFGSSAETRSDLVFPTPPAWSAEPTPDGIEDDMVLAGLDIDFTEFLETKAVVDPTSSLPGETPRTERRSYVIVVGRRPE